MRRIPLLQAADDPQLLGAGLTLWPRQRELLADLERGDRIHVWALGRRSGKSTMMALASLHNLLFRPDLDEMMRPGETRFAIGVATNQSQARLIVDAARTMIDASPLLLGLVDRELQDGLDFRLPTGARVALRAFPCNSRGGRGWPVSFLALDEAAHFLDGDSDGGDQTAGRVWSALVPATAQFGDGARVVVSSTPWGTEGLFADLFNKASTGELAHATAHRASTAEVNPTISSDFLAAEQARDPDNYLSEYEAQFVGSAGAFLDLDRCDVADHGEAPPTAATGWIAGLDPAFSADDFGVALVGRDLADPHRLVVGAVRAFSPRRATTVEAKRRLEDELLGDVVSTLKGYTSCEAVTDQYQSVAVTDRLRRAGIFCRVHIMTATSKTDIFVELRSRLYDGTLTLPNDPHLLAELRRLRTSHSAGGSRVVTPRVGGSHGDRAQALALAVGEHAIRGVSEGSARSGGGTMLGRRSVERALGGGPASLDGPAEDGW